MAFPFRPANPDTLSHPDGAPFSDPAAHALAVSLALGPAAAHSRPNRQSFILPLPLALAFRHSPTDPKRHGLAFSDRIPHGIAESIAVRLADAAQNSRAVGGG